MVKKKGFVENSYNGTGTYASKLETEGAAVAIDARTGLMWHIGGSPRRMKFKSVKKWIKNLNRKQHGGYSDWRLPTLEEAASLLRRAKNRNGQHTAAAFSGKQAGRWTWDRFGSAKMWSVRFSAGIVYGYSKSSKQYVRPVRTIKKK